MALEAGFRIGTRKVFPMEGRIAGPDGDLRIEPKAMAVLVELARHAPGVCTRDQIVGNVWPRGFVSDDVLTRCIGQVRRALGDDPRAAACIETIPKRGYRLRVPISDLQAGVESETEPSPRTESLIVLPFQNLSAATNDYIADGLTELLILRLAALRGIRVISRTTAMQFKTSRADITEIAARTGTDWVIEGSVLQSGDQLQVVAQLIDARTDGHIWAADYVRDLRDLLSLQNEIARRVASAIRRQLGATDETPVVAVSLAPDVMRRYLHGRHLASRRTVVDLRAALAEFRSVVGAAPDFASGWASAAECEMLLAHYGARDLRQLLADCSQHLELALSLDPDLGIGLSTRGAVRFFFERDFAGAAADVERALAMAPSYSLAMLSRANICIVRHEFEEAAAWMDQALLVDPLDVGINMNMGDHCILRRRYADAVNALERGLGIAPRHRPCQLRLGWALALAGRNVEASRQLEQAGPSGDADAQWHEFAALVAAAAGDHEAAGLQYDTLRRMDSARGVPAWSMARAAAAAKRPDDALACLEAAGRQRSSSIPFMMVTPAFDGLRADARFQSLGAALGLPRTDLRYRT